MGGLFSASIRAPLVGVVLAAELTGGYALILPLIVTCVTANAVAQALGSRPLYELLLERTLRLAGKVPPPPCHDWRADAGRYGRQALGGVDSGNSASIQNMIRGCRSKGSLGGSGPSDPEG
jgi:hypothetical protein